MDVLRPLQELAFRGCLPSLMDKMLGCMLDPRFHLIGTYRTPRFEYASVVIDAIRGEVQIVGISDAHIPWPIGKRGRAKSLVIYGGLVQAIHSESNQAICHWWGVTAQTVSKWRKVLGVPQNNAGTLHRRRELWPNISAKMDANRRYTPERNRKIGDARRGTSHTQRTITKIRRTLTGRKLPERTRQKMKETHRRLGTHPPVKLWTAAEDEIVRQFSPIVAAEQTGRSIIAVWKRRYRLGITRRRGTSIK